MNTQVLSGSVKRVFYGKGFGFLAGDDGQEYFFHLYEVSGGQEAFDQLTPGDRVKFFAEPRSFKNQAGEQVEGWKALRVRSAKEVA